MKLKGVTEMRFENYYVSEYRRVLDNIKMNEDRLVNFTENIEKNIERAKSDNAKRVAVASAVAVAVGAGVGVSLHRRK